MADTTKTTKTTTTATTPDPLAKAPDAAAPVLIEPSPPYMAPEAVPARPGDVIVVETEDVEIVDPSTLPAPTPAPAEPLLISPADVVLYPHVFPAPPEPPNGHLDGYALSVIRWIEAVFDDLYDHLSAPPKA